MVKVVRVAANDVALMDPAAPVWDALSPSQVTLQPTPITAQPSVYVQAKWKATPYGKIDRLSVKSAHDGDRVYFHLSWTDETGNHGIGDTDQFADAAAVLFPARGGDAPLLSMGSPQAPVNAWYWRPDLEEPFSVIAEGIGTTRRARDLELHAVGAHSETTWTIVIARRLISSLAGDVSLLPGLPGKVAFAVWQGADQERGGLKAASADWEPLEIEA